MGALPGSMVPWSDASQLGGLLETPPFFVTVIGRRSSVGVESMSTLWLLPGQSLDWVILPVRCSQLASAVM